MKITYIVVAAIAAVVIGAIALASFQDAERLAKLYYEKSTFTSGNGGPRPIGESLALPDHTKPAKPAHVADEVARAAVAKTGVSGRLLGTYLYNATHYVTLVDEGPLSAYAVIWNNETAAAVRLNFTKYVERSFNGTVGEYGEYKFVGGGDRGTWATSRCPAPCPLAYTNSTTSLGACGKPPLGTTRRRPRDGSQWCTKLLYM